MREVKKQTAILGYMARSRTSATFQMFVRMAHGSFPYEKNRAIQNIHHNFGGNIMLTKISSTHRIRACFLTQALLLVLVLLFPSVASAGTLHDQPWLKPTTGDLRRDLAAAETEGKRLTLIWEQVGCVYCKKMHEVNFQQAKTVQLITSKFYPVQLDMRGNGKIIDFDGQQLDEAGLARKHHVNGTPTIEFRDDQSAEVFRMPGYAEPPIFDGVLEYVASKAYTKQELIPWLKAKYLGQGKQPGDG